MAAKSIQEVELRVTAETGRLRSELNDVNTKLGTMQSKAGGAGGGVMNLVGSIGKFVPAAIVAEESLRLLIKGFSDMVAKEDQLADFSAITGVTGAKLQEFGDIATDLSNKFGTSVVENIEAFKGTLSRLGPGFASSTIAVEKMGDSINTLSKASGLDAPAAMDALTTAMLQFGVDLSNPIMAANEGAEMMNVMAAAAKEGAAEIPAITEALSVVGGVARNAGSDFADLNTAIQMAAQAGIYGSEAGTQLRGVILGIQAPTEDARKAFEDYNLSVEKIQVALSTRGLGGAMEELKRQLSTVSDENKRVELTAKLVEKANVALANKLQEQAGPAWEKFNASISNNVVAQEQMAVKMDTLSSRWDVFSTKVSNLVSGALSDLTANLQTQILMFTDLIGLTGEAPRNLQREKESIDKVVEGYNILNPQIRQQIEDEKKRKEAIEKAALSAEQAAKREGDAKKKTRGTGRREKSPLEIENEAFEKARYGIARLHEEWTGFVSSMEPENMPIQNLSNTIVAPIEPAITALDRLNIKALEFGDTLTGMANGAQSITDPLVGIFQNVATAAGEGSAIAKAAGITNATIQTYYAATAAYASAASIPFIGFILGPIAAAAALAAGFANVNKIASLAVGTTQVPSDQLAQLHKGETVIPKTFAEGVRSGDMALVGGGKQRRGRVKRQAVDARVHVVQFASMSQSAAYETGRLNR